MLFTFKSATTANLIMHDSSGREILALLGKNSDDPAGIITVDQMPEALRKLREAISLDKAGSPKPNTGEQETDDEEQVSFSQRAVPFIDMLEAAAKSGEPVTWGV